jgi:hypothetical protein
MEARIEMVDNPNDQTVRGGWTPVTDRGRRVVITTLLAGAALDIVYWALWFGARSTVASETTRAYYDFENAFPPADGWLFVSFLAAYTLWRRRPAALFWLLVAGGSTLYLLGLDVLYDLEHGIWAKGGGGVFELAINVATAVVGFSILRWAWRRRESLLRP